eukprot:gnl/TRDRNA2_/TRDRNA2_208755_c0_seq1.p1 gnl/TRDRNA2_/TRDRNA2_208755_c0~~gnl/TRDRNA2_/TRDRNA2_208755_c0_seq1.p1  ORF type:complete len:129 (-),score=13.08 gnl/TRDRNA2_/TRDRNA2_208755_c0_seq1:13-399(-)
MTGFDIQNLANTAWAFTMTVEPVPALLDPVHVLGSADGIRTMAYQICMQCLAATGQVVAGFALLRRGEASGFLSHSDKNCFPVFRSLLEACRAVHDSAGASLVHAARERISWMPLPPGAQALVKRSEP